MTSNRSTDQERKALASRAPVPTGPTQLVTARNCGGRAGCGVQTRFALACRVDDNAHSTCGHTAAGEAWMYTTPDVTSANWFDARICCSFGSTRDVFPNDLVNPTSRMPAVKFRIFVSCVSIVPCDTRVALVCGSA
ncbi:Uncharacterised protein [Mycobacterium tuberculosis]|uniref:Uncharacterized protein n=1 Tax=Mycobacterium tuberculosis TaxID=1773 RepID=A0A655AND6_MYCTX|nr:Uncharacterised protein [Mycobacterium tuberculosis]CKT31393.1 Uncharacterised protein [Mycobacterium tuberculosis]COY45860.1 Uncharacterised protein [Mycobacterium tuberculosis]